MVRLSQHIGALLVGVALLLSCSEDPADESEASTEGLAIGGDNVSPACITAKNGVVLFTDRGWGGSPAGVYRTEVGGTSSVMLAAAELDPSFLVTDGSAVWWIERSSDDASRLRRASVDGGEAETLDDRPTELGALAIDTQNVYYADRSSGAIFKVPREGGAPQELTTANTTVVVALAADGQYLYFTLAYDAPGGQILRMPTDGSAGPTPVVSNLGAPFSLAIYQDQICFRELQQGKIGCAPKDGSGPATTLAVQQSFIPLGGFMLAIDENSLFYPSGKELFRLARAPGSQPEIVARAGGFTFAIDAAAVDDTNVYWADSSTLRQVDKTFSLEPPSGTTPLPPARPTATASALASSTTSTTQATPATRRSPP